MSRRSARIHGGPVAEELATLGLDPSRVVDFSVNLNPYGPSPAVEHAVLTAAVGRYPDPTARAAREAIAGVVGVDPDEVVLGAGSADLLWTLARVLAGPGRTVVVVEPAFSELRAAVLAVGGRTVEWRARVEDGFRVDLAAAFTLAREHRASTLYLATPCNPTGVSVPADEIATLAQERPEIAVILDQAFLSLSDRVADLDVRFPPNVVRVRSFTKEQAIPGVRVGYLLADRDVAARVETSRPVWSTSAAAQAAARAACREAAFVDGCRGLLLADRDALRTALPGVGLAALPSSAPYLLVPVGDAASLRARLLREHHVLVRDCTSFGLPEHVRLAARPATDRHRLLAALACMFNRSTGLS